MNLSNKTFLPTLTYKTRNWFIIDCEGQTLGRLATIVATLLKGKIKSHYHPSLDVGDYLILTNINLITLNEKSNHYFVYNPGRPGSSLKIRNASDCLPNVIIEKAVRGMLSQSKKKILMRRLKLYRNTQHPHAAQKPTKLNISNLYCASKLEMITES